LTLESEDFVQVFRYSHANTTWEQLGGDILVDGLLFADFGSALSLSKDSTRLAIASPEGTPWKSSLVGCVRVTRKCL